MQLRNFLVVAISALYQGTLLAFASSGDRSLPFQQCLEDCIVQQCAKGDLELMAWPLALRLTRWTCADDCKYSCMHAVTDAVIEAGTPVEQFYGKWPFWRLLGVQEPASVLFSLLNLWIHVRGYQALKRRVPDGHPIKSYLLTWSVVSMNAWLWSAIFHTRDKPITERMDYFSAALVFIAALHIAVTRFFFLGRLQRNNLFYLWTTICIITFVMHVSYLSLLPRFDYTYNIVFGVTLGLIHNALWILYALPPAWVGSVLQHFPPSGSALAIPNSRVPARPTANKIALCVTLTMAAMMLELSDFPPLWRVIDAHSLWHASTVPIAALWYSSLIEDALDEGWKIPRKL